MEKALEIKSYQSNIEHRKEVNATVMQVFQESGAKWYDRIMSAHLQKILAHKKKSKEEIRRDYINPTENLSNIGSCLRSGRRKQIFRHIEELMGFQPRSGTEFLVEEIYQYASWIDIRNKSFLHARLLQTGSRNLGLQLR